MSGLRWVAAVMAVLVAGVVAPPPAGAAGPAQRPLPPPPITVTTLVTGDGTALQQAVKINERGEVLAHLVGESYRTRPAVWRRGAVTRLGPEGIVAYSSDFSERGEVVGFERGSHAFETFPFSWSRSGWSRLPTEMPGGWALDANDRGQVLGAQTESIDFGPTETVVWDGGELVTPPPGPPLGGAPLLGIGMKLINNRGQAAVTLADERRDCGWFPPSPPCRLRAAIWQVGGEVRDLGTLGGATSSASAINERGDVIGISATASGERRAFRWRDGEMVDLGTLGGAWIEPVALNDRGDVIGTSETASGETHAFLWRDGQMTRLESLGGTVDGPASSPVGINSWGQVVGTSYTPEGERHAVLWQGGRTIDLGALVEGDSAAADINDRGQIVGSAAAEGEGSRAVLWTTFPLWGSAWP